MNSRKYAHEAKISFLFRTFIKLDSLARCTYAKVKKKEERVISNPTTVSGKLKITGYQVRFRADQFQDKVQSDKL